MTPPAQTAAAPVASRPHVLIALGGDDVRARLARALGDQARITVLELDGRDGLDWPRAPVDVALLEADGLGVAATPLLRDVALGLPELVFVVDDAWSPQRFALESRGYHSIVTRADLVDWLPDALARLCAVARTRRLAMAAAAARPSVPAVTPGRAQARTMKLHAAETAFREAFLRLLLLEHGSRRAAAEAAGVPYRSFCGMLRKLGI